MPRLSPSFLRSAHSIDSLLPLLLRTCRDLPSASNELRWLREHVLASSRAQNHDDPIAQSGHPYAHTLSRSATLYKLCLERSRGKPLQYILGSQPFGELEILCRRGVLIPRLETETYTTHLAAGITSSAESHPFGSLRILDLCTGTGCISLLLHSLLAPYIPTLSILGIDNSHAALSLATTNLRHNICSGHLHRTAAAQIRFAHGDVLSGIVPVTGDWDILISNPPYISPSGFDRDTERSVRNWEPRGALVPPAPGPSGGQAQDPRTKVDRSGDTFYAALLRIAAEVNAKVVVVEVGGSAQAKRVVETVHGGGYGFWEGCEVWCDDMDGSRRKNAVAREENGKEVRYRVVGRGNGRTMVCWRSGGKRWLGNT